MTEHSSSRPRIGGKKNAHHLMPGCADHVGSRASEGQKPRRKTCRLRCLQRKSTSFALIASWVGPWVPHSLKLNQPHMHLAWMLHQKNASSERGRGVHFPDYALRLTFWNSTEFPSSFNTPSLSISTFVTPPTKCMGITGAHPEENVWGIHTPSSCSIFFVTINGAIFVTFCDLSLFDVTT